MARKPTNEQFMARMMSYSKHGALMQMFILTAIEKYALMVQHEYETNPDFMKAKDGHIMMIDRDAWKGVADEALERVNQHLGG